MAFAWTDFLELAKEISSRSDDAALRSALSRAYYAAFGMAIDALEAAGHSISRAAAAHSQVWLLYQQANNGPRHYIGVDGARLRNLRRMADY